MQIEKSFIDGDRYMFDFSLIPTKKWGQVDTDQDAWFYGTWANPFELKIISYTEGDVCKIKCETEDEFREEFEKIKKHEADRGSRRPPRIDPGFNEELKQKFIEVCLEKFLHGYKL